MQATFAGIIRKHSRCNPTEISKSNRPFSCLEEKQAPGYYADVATGCRSYHVCDGHSQFTYVCPPRTLFQPKARICDHAYLVECEESAEEDYSFQENVLYDDFVGTTDTSSSSIVRDSSTVTEVQELFGQRTYSTGKTTGEGTTTWETEVRQNSTGTEPVPATTEKVPVRLPVTIRPSAVPTTTATSAAAAAPPRPTSTEVFTSSLGTLPTTSSFPENLTQRTQVFDQPTVKITVKDFRHLFFIPPDNNSTVVTKPPKVVVLSAPENLLVRFANGKSSRKESGISCPSYCNPRFFVGGTCHPCVTVK
ncbi:hypothetical protein RUM43_007925 [Polyplax serrata]|uniref:Chitin-binding type-2 domain-containing protein n=1 Tax=Polyplax serrata TaxID=468196 RepID=A0AAN8PY76_POLSC